MTDLKGNYLKFLNINLTVKYEFNLYFYKLFIVFFLDLLISKIKLLGLKFVI